MDKAKFFALKERAKQLEEATREGMNVTFLSLASPNSDALKVGTDTCIPGLCTGEYYVNKDKRRLGSDLRVIPLGFFNAFNHFASLDQNADFLGVVSQEDGRNFPFADITFNGKANYSIRELPDGTILRPVVWVPVILPDFPDVKNAVLTFKATSVPVARNWKKAIEKTDNPSVSFVCTLSFKWEKNEKNSWIVPDVAKIEDILTTEVAIPDEIIEEAFELSVKYLEEYSAGKFFPSKLTSPTASAALPAPGASVTVSSALENYNDDIPF